MNFFGQSILYVRDLVYTPSDHLHIDVQSSSVLRGVISHLLDQLRKKDVTIQDLSSTLKTARPHATHATPTKKQHPITSHRMDHVTSAAGMDSLVERLRAQVARLEYENAKLKVDLQNKSVKLLLGCDE